MCRSEDTSVGVTILIPAWQQRVSRLIEVHGYHPSTLVQTQKSVALGPYSSSVDDYTTVLCDKTRYSDFFLPNKMSVDKGGAPVRICGSFFWCFHLPFVAAGSSLPATRLKLHM